MTFAERALQGAFKAIRSTNGEPLLFRGAVVKGLVNRTPFDRVVRTPDFDPRDASRIEFDAAEIDGVPRAGEEIIDTRGMLHRVQTAKRVAPFYACECVSSEPTNPILATEGGALILTEGGEALQTG